MKVRPTQADILHDIPHLKLRWDDFGEMADTAFP